MPERSETTDNGDERETDSIHKIYHTILFHYLGLDFRRGKSVAGRFVAWTALACLAVYDSRLGLRVHNFSTSPREVHTKLAASHRPHLLLHSTLAQQLLCRRSAALHWLLNC